MEFLFGVTELSVPLVQEIVWLSGLKYNVLDCLKPPYYFIQKGSVPIENHAGHNLAQHAKLTKPKWIGAPPQILIEDIEQFIKETLDSQTWVNVEKTPTCFQYCFLSDVENLKTQNEKYGWGIIMSCFKNYFTIDQNRITELFMRDLGNIQIIDLKQFEFLSYLDVEQTKIEQLDCSCCPNLTYIDCSKTLIQHLDLTNCKLLKTVHCYRVPLQTLEIRTCLTLRVLACSNTDLTELVLPLSPNFEYLSCDHTNISKLEFLVQVPILDKIYCDHTSIRSLNLQKCSHLRYLECDKGTKIINQPKDLVVESVSV